MEGQSPFQITQVSVSKVDGVKGSPLLEEAVRYRSQNIAYKVSESGKAYHLDIELLRFFLHDPANAFFGSQGSYLTARVEIIDPETEKTVTAFDEVASIHHGGGIIGAIASSTIDDIEEEQNLANQLAVRLMNEIYGPAAMAAAAKRTPTRTESPNYPISIEEARQHVECKNEIKDRQLETAAFAGAKKRIKPLPQACLDLGYETPTS
ncbi:hypothetical protein ACTL6U_13770 [Rhodovibrionaceae bacterium A322]